MFNMLVHSTDLGAAPKLDNVQNSFSVQPAHPIEHVWAWVSECARRNGSIGNLLIAAHGGYVKLDHFRGEAKGSAKGMVGGFGIALGSPGMNNNNVYLTSNLKGMVKNIYLFVCGGSLQIPDVLEVPDDPESHTWGRSVIPAKVPNNRQLCFDLAAYTEANVYASTSEQAFAKGSWNKDFNFGAWEGPVQKFSPYGNITDVTSRMHKFGEETGDE